MENYPKMLYAKLPMICFIMLLVLALPNNEEIKNLADKLRSDHITKRDKVTAKLKGRPQSEPSKEGGSAE